MSKEITKSIALPIDPPARISHFFTLSVSTSHSSTLVLTSNEIEQILRHFGLNQVMDTLIISLQQAIEGFEGKQFDIPIRSGFHYQKPHAGLIEWMPIHEHDKQIVIKVVGYHPANPKQFDLPTILSTISAYDTASGHLLALVDGVLLTALRTGAASAVASKFMAHPESRTLGLIGCGAQAITQLHALSRIFPIERVLYYDKDESSLNSFKDRCKILELTADMCPASMEVIVPQVDILCTATSIEVGEGPLFEETDTLAHLHINAVGSDFPGKTELPLAMLKSSLVVPDFRIQAIREGECQQLSEEQIGPDWVELIQQLDKYQELPYQHSVFDSTGWPLEDQLVMELFLDYAVQLGIGQKIHIESNPVDAKNPYHSLTKQQNEFFLA